MFFDQTVNKAQKKSHHEHITYNCNKHILDDTYITPHNLSSMSSHIISRTAMPCLGLQETETLLLGGKSVTALEDSFDVGITSYRKAFNKNCSSGEATG
jgi:hypothetical protein